MVIGLRAFPDGFAFVIMGGTQSDPRVVAYDRYFFPKGNSWPSNLSWLRRQAEELLDKHSPERACIKGVEAIAKRKSPERLHAEAVLIESLYSLRGIETSVRIKSQLKRDIANFAEPARYLEKLLEGQDSLKELNTPKFNEAALAAIAELPSE